MINRWGSLQTFQTISAQETSWRLPLWSALVTVALAQLVREPWPRKLPVFHIWSKCFRGRFLFNHTIHKFPTSIILLSITKRAYFCLFLYHHFIIIWVSFILFLWKGKAIEWQKLPALKDFDDDISVVSHHSNNKSTVVSHMKVVFVVPNFTKSLIRLVSHFIP